ncbi:hypothetical protein [Paenibacillus arenosi]|uniref:Uncharacterized protein n=1 Tax=Paenibacillus arenosi TaxID=2774142 RepID=A0ABR9B274_9BACL|nr:hypothetical protein [Paenibacillus arenosi]MBD8500477.1 hypothetical protein [Paenibacillus arenosi]
MKYKVNMKVVKPRSSIRGIKTVRSANTTKQVARLRASNPDDIQDLNGGNLYRLVYNRILAPGVFHEFLFNGRQVDNNRVYRPVSGGWWIEDNNVDLPTCTTNYSASQFQWNTVLYNPSTESREAKFVIIARRTQN